MAWSASPSARPQPSRPSTAPTPARRPPVQAYHDEDGNGRLRKGLFGIPTEAIGFSRDARVRLGAPSFEDAAIDMFEPATATRLRLRHLGP